MRARAAVLAVSVAVLAAAQAPAAGATTVHLRASGSLRVVWHGDRAAGCEAAGMCAYSGSIQYPVAPKALLEIDRFFGAAELFGFLDADGPATTRVRRTVPGAPAAVCHDAFRDFGFTLDVEHAYRDRRRLMIGTNVVPAPRTSGRCAGPRLSDFAGSLPTATFRLRDLKRRGTRLNLAGRFPFTAGPLTGEVISTLALRTRRTTKDRFLPDSGGRVRSRRVVAVEVDYSVTRAHGEVSADFRAVESPVCAMLDACGASGRESFSFAASRGTMHLFGSAPVRSRRKPKLREAIAMAARHGDLDGFATFEHGTGTTTATFVRAGAPACADALSSPVPGLSLSRARRRVRVAFGPSGFVRDEDEDVLRGRCPGPTERDVLRRKALASTILDPRALARRQLHPVLTLAGGFSSRGYRGRRRGRLELDLTRTRARVALTREFIISGGGSAAQRP